MGIYKYEVIESRRYVRDDGAKASIYGACPWQSAAEEARWKIETVGYTVRNPYTGQVGIGRAPWKTSEEAQAFANQFPANRTPIGD
jgi:hypothetical protein